MKSNISTFFLAVAAAAVFSSASRARAELPYIDENGNPASRSSVEWYRLENSDDKDGFNLNDNWTSWYGVDSKDSNVTFNRRIPVNGDVKLVIADGCTLTVNGGFEVSPSNSLTIYGQAGGGGKLFAHGSESCAGIGGGNGTVVISGGEITAQGSTFGAGIGGGYQEAVGTITISGGAVTATGVEGGGYGWYDDCMTIGNWSGAVSGWSGDAADPTDLGVLTNLELRGVSFNIWSEANDRGGANVYFQVHDSSGPVGEVQDIWAFPAVPIAGKAHDFAIAYGIPEDLAAGAGLVLEEGREYGLEVWAKSYGDSGDEWYSNGGANYHAKFTYSATLPPVATATGVPFEWLQAKAPNILAENGGDFEAAAAATAANGRDTVRDCYVAGLEPEDPGAAFLAEIDFSSGSLEINCRPEPEEGRVLVLEALKTMAETNWTDVSLLDDPAGEGWRFFRLGIDLATEAPIGDEVLYEEDMGDGETIQERRHSYYEDRKLGLNLSNGKVLLCALPLSFPDNYRLASSSGTQAILFDGTTSVAFTYQDFSSYSQELVDTTVATMLKSYGEGVPCGEWTIYEYGGVRLGIQVYQKQLVIVSSNADVEFLQATFQGIRYFDIR